MRCVQHAKHQDVPHSLSRTFSVSLVLKGTPDLGNVKSYSKSIAKFRVMFCESRFCVSSFFYVKNIKICRGNKQLFFYDRFNIIEAFAEMLKWPISFAMTSVSPSFNGVPIGIISMIF